VTEQAIVEWVRTHGIPLDSSLESLRDVFADARVVAMGEASHGTHEFFALRARLTRFLVRELGFTTVAMEAPWHPCSRIDAYLRRGAGNPEQLVRAIGFWTLRSSELVELVEWLRSQGGACFAGYDIQAPHLAILHAVNYVRRLQPTHAAAFELHYAKFLHYALFPGAYAGLPAGERSACRRQLRLARQHLLEHRETYDSASSPIAFARALQDATVAVQAEDVFGRLGSHVRDRYLAANVLRLVDSPGSHERVVAWGHNLHLGRFSLRGGYSSAGALLKRELGPAMLSVGFTFGAGALYALPPVDAATAEPQPRVHALAAPPDGSVEATFALGGVSPLLVDLRSPPPGPVARWVRQSRPMRMIGAVYDASTPERYFAQVRPQRAFDLLAYVGRSSPSHLLR
jgi:erythromycin esterase